MSDRFHSPLHPKLQNAYAAWADALPRAQIVAIALSDPIHAMAAFFGTAHVGRTACLETPDMAAQMDDRFSVLAEPLEGSDASVTAKDAVPFITFTSGSTNAPKAILRDHQSWIYSFNRNGIRPDDRVAVLGSLTHSLAHYAACEAMHIGADVIFCPRRASGTPSVIYATPTQLRLFYAGQVKDQVRLIMVGGGHFSAADYAFCAEMFPNATVRVFYGTAETSFISIADQTTPAGSVGQAYEGVEITVSDKQLSVKSPMMALGYLDDAAQFTPNTAFATGELGWLDADENLFLHGRSDRAVTLSDKTVYLDAIEADLMQIKGITRAGVVALPDAKRGLRAYGAVMGGTATHKGLGGIAALDDWPTLLSGKTDYVRLTEILLKEFS